MLLLNNIRNFYYQWKWQTQVKKHWLDKCNLHLLHFFGIRGALFICNLMLLWVLVMWMQTELLLSYFFVFTWTFSVHVSTVRGGSVFLEPQAETSPQRPIKLSDKCWFKLYTRGDKWRTHNIFCRLKVKSCILLPSGPLELSLVMLDYFILFQQKTSYISMLCFF